MYSPSKNLLMGDLSLSGSLRDQKPTPPITTIWFHFHVEHKIYKMRISLWKSTLFVFSNAQISAALHKHASQRDPDPWGLVTTAT